jgi:hypothetical protein
VSQWTRDERASANASKCRTSAWASYCARDAPLAASSRADGARICRRRGFKAAFSCAERSACRFRRARPAISFDRQSDRTLASPSCMGFRTTLSCQHHTDLPSAQPGYSNKLARRLDAAARHLRVRPAHGSRIARMPGMCRYVALATDHERNAAPSRDVHGDWRSHVVRPSRRRYAIPQGRSATAE